MAEVDTLRKRGLDQVTKKAFESSTHACNEGFKSRAYNWGESHANLRVLAREYRRNLSVPANFRQDSNIRGCSCVKVFTYSSVSQFY